MSEELQRSLGRIEGHLTDIGRRLDARDRAHEKLDRRVSSLERWRTWIAGAGAVITGLFGVSHLPKF